MTDMIQYKNLTIRQAEAADAKQLTAWWNDGAVMAHAGFPNGLGTTEEEVIEALENGLMVIEESNRLIGECNYCSTADGVAKIKLNGWEQAVLAEEQKREDYVCWLRNPSRQAWALRMPYEIDGKCKEMYPDFIIVRRDPILTYVIDILEPHNPDFKDNLGKAKGLANYAANEPRIGRVQRIRIGKDAAKNDRFKRLDLAKGTIRNKVLAAINTDELDHIFDTDGVFED